MEPKISRGLFLGFIFLVCSHTSTVPGGQLQSEAQNVKTQIKIKPQSYHQVYLQFLAYAHSAVFRLQNALAHFAVFNFFVDSYSHCNNSKSLHSNLFEAIEVIYDNPKYSEFVESTRPISYPIHHFPWTFPTLMNLMSVY